MADYNFDGGVEMGRLNSPRHTDNTLRVFSHVDKIHLQLRHEGWYLVRKLTFSEAVNLIRILSTELSAMQKAEELASEFSGLTPADEPC